MTGRPDAVSPQPDGDAGGASSKQMQSFSKGLRANLGVALAGRAITFGLNVALARAVESSASYGVAMVSFQLFNQLGLFFNKEGFRRVALRLVDNTADGSASASGDDKTRLPASLRIAWQSGFVGVLINLLLFGFWWRSSSGKGDGGEGVLYQVALVAMLLANIVEVFCEPLVVAEVQFHRDYQAKPLGEGFALVGRTFVLCVLVLVCKTG